MPSVTLSANAFVFLHLLIITAYALPAYLQLTPPSIADRPNVFSPHLLNNSISTPRIPATTEALTRPSEPLPAIDCDRGASYDRSVKAADCLYIAAQIEDSPDAKTPRVYRGTDDDLDWGHGNCSVEIFAFIRSNTDTFRPTSIAFNIRRMVAKCDTWNTRLGGQTRIGPAQKFALAVENDE